MELQRTASNKMRFEQCLDARGEPQYMISIRGHSGVPEGNQKLFTLVGPAYGWKDPIYHTGSSNNYRSIVQGGLIAEGTIDRTGRQACFFSAMHPLDNPLPEVSDVPTGVPEMVHHKHSKGPDLDAVYVFDLRIEQDQRLEILSNQQLCHYLA